MDPTQHKRIDKARLPAALQDQIQDITHQRSEAEVRKSIEEDFAQKLVDYKTSQSGNEYRLFGHTMVTYDQLSENVNSHQCVSLTASHVHFSESL